MHKQNRNELLQGLGFYGATSVVAGTMIGTAIFVGSIDDVGRWAARAVT